MLSSTNRGLCDIYVGLVMLGISFVLGFIEIKIGSFPITDIATRPMLAFIVGVFCGISELALPGSVAKRASDFIGRLTQRPFAGFTSS